MTTRLAGTATRFLPFDKGNDDAAGNPPDPAGRSYRTAYFWEDVLGRDSLLDLLARFIHLQVEEKRDDRGRKAKVEAMIFPRYHQRDAVRTLVDAARNDGVGENYLIEHSAGSGKSNTIGWLAHRLVALHDDGDERVFDSVVLDQQLQDTIYQFEHRQGVVQKIDESSRQLAEALESGVPVIITTLQKFPFVSGQLLTMAEERGEEATGTLPTRRCAVIVDEAHSSQGGEAATDLKEVLGGEGLREQAAADAAEEDLEDKGDPQAVRSAVTKLRRNFGNDARNPRYILGEHGMATACPSPTAREGAPPVLRGRGRRRLTHPLHQHPMTFPPAKLALVSSETAVGCCEGHADPRNSSILWLLGRNRRGRLSSVRKRIESISRPRLTSFELAVLREAETEMPSADAAYLDPPSARSTPT